MQATQALRNRAAILLAQDSSTLAQAVDANRIALIKQPFNPTEVTDLSSLVFADFDGSTPINVELGNQLEGLDPSTSDSIIDLVAPIGGFRWQVSGTTNLPQTIYGFALVNHDSTVLLACQNLDAPINLNAVGQRVDDLKASLRLHANSLT